MNGISETCYAIAIKNLNGLSILTAVHHDLSDTLSCVRYRILVRDMAARSDPSEGLVPGCSLYGLGAEYDVVMRREPPQLYDDLRCHDNT